MRYPRYDASERPSHRRNAKHQIRSGASLHIAAGFVLVAALVLVFCHPSAARADGPQLYDSGVIMTDARDRGAVNTVEAQYVQYFTDCAPGDAGGCGGPPAHWTHDQVPVTFCTFQVNRPPGITAQQYRDAVTAAAQMWNATNVAVGVRYTGDCTSGARWDSASGRNEIGFDDDRHVITGATAGVSRGSWTNLPAFGPVQDRQFVEFDIVLSSQLNVSDRCFRSIVAHEMGHALGFGHSDDRNDLMYPTYDPSDPQSCRLTASPAERARLAGLYGPNLPAALSIQAPTSAFVGTVVTLSATATDPEGDPVTFEWSQLAGPTVSLSANGANASFMAPSLAGSTLQFRVTALDYYLHESTRDVTISIDVATAAPSTAPSLHSFLPGPGAAILSWTPVTNSARYEFCDSVSCITQATPQVAISWDSVLGDAGDPTERRVITTGARPTYLAACNSIGCSKPGPGPFAGGVSWPAWGIDFDFIAMAFDVPAAGVRFTIGGVVNETGVARKFTIYSGSEDNPLATLVQNCGNVSAGGVCIGVLTPQQGGHWPALTIVSELDGTPTTEQRVAIR